MSAQSAMNVNSMEQEFDGLSVEEQLLEDMVAPQASSTSRLLMRRLVQPVGVLVAAAVVGYGGYAVHFQTRLREPMEPIGVAETEDVDHFTELTFKRPLVDRTHCRGVGDRPTAYCNPQGVCCNNDHGWAYCCAIGNECYRNVCIAGPGQCFPGDAEVTLADGNKKRLDDLKVGEHVLVENSAGSQDYEPVLAFLHQVPGRHESLMVEHARGTFRVSANHLVFTQDGKGKRLDKIAAQLEVGDLIYLPSSAAQKEQVVPVISVHSSDDDSGMYAPLTSSGTIVVDGILASNYASHSPAAWISHGTIHAAFMPVRIYHLLGFGMPSKSNMAEGGVELHPFADFLVHVGKAMGQYK